MVEVSMLQVKVKALFEKITKVTMLRVQVKILLCSLLLTISLAYYFLCDNQTIHMDNGSSKIKIDNAAPPNSITLYESVLIDANIISTIRGITKEKVDLKKSTGEKKPKLYLQVGPTKHGTISLQCTLARIQVSCTSSLPPTDNSHIFDAQHLYLPFHEQKELNSDNYYYIGINNMNCIGKNWTGELPEFDTQKSIKLVTKCFNKGEDHCDTSRWRSFLDVLNQYRVHNKHINVIYSFESFGTIDSGQQEKIPHADRPVGCQNSHELPPLPRLGAEPLYGDVQAKRFDVWKGEAVA